MAHAQVRNETNVVFIGGFRCGKSTICGRLLHDVAMSSSEQQMPITAPAFRYGVGVRDQRQWDQLRSSDDTPCYSWALDTSDERREQATIHTHHVCSLGRLRIIDSPGHHRYKRGQGMLVSASEVAALVVSAEAAHVEGSLKGAQAGKGLEGAVHRCVKMIKGFGIKRVLVLVNQLDRVDEPRQAFYSVKRKVSRILKQWGVAAGEYTPKSHKEYPFSFRQRIWTLLLIFNRLKTRVPLDVITVIARQMIGMSSTFIPVCGESGENLVTPAFRNFYSGPTLFELLQRLPATTDPALCKRSLRFTVLENFRVPGVGTVLRVKVRSGMITPQQEIQLYSNKDDEMIRRGRVVKSIYMSDMAVSEAIAGQICHISIRPSLPFFLRERIKGGSGGEALSSPIANEFTAQLLSLKELKPGMEFQLMLHSTRVAVKLVAVHWCGTRKKRINSPGAVLSKQPAEVLLSFTKNRVFFERYRDLPSMSRFVMYFNQTIVGLGHII